MEKNINVNDTLIRNVIACISTNIYINIPDFANIYGGTYVPSKFPGAIKIIEINGNRYSISIFSTGRILLQNILDLSELNLLIGTIIGLLHECLNSGIATFSEDILNEVEIIPLLGIKKTRKLKILFTIENIQCAFKLTPKVISLSNDILINNLKNIEDNNFINTSGYMFEKNINRSLKKNLKLKVNYQKISILVAQLNTSHFQQQLRN
jgi:hypothetical protein